MFKNLYMLKKKYLLILLLVNILFACVAGDSFFQIKGKIIDNSGRIISGNILFNDDSGRKGCILKKYTKNNEFVSLAGINNPFIQTFSISPYGSGHFYFSVQCELNGSIIKTKIYNIDSKKNYNTPINLGIIIIKKKKL